MDLLHDTFESYERRYSSAMATMPTRLPWIDRDRSEIIETAKRCLGLREEWVPEIHASVCRLLEQDGFSIEHLQATSWAGCHVSAHLYLPQEPTENPMPAIILACGHGPGGKQSPSYRLMARHLARHGIAVLVPDNIGQGERIAMGHSDVVQVFECGLSLQGLIVMETIGWLNWLCLQEQRFDFRRIGAIGNSGGGTLTMFLAALCRDKLAVISSSGYPSAFEFVARKEKKHCHCNLLPGVVGELEMWQLYGCFAPKPLFLFQGSGDELFPSDLLRQTARKVYTVYRQRDAADQFEMQLMEGRHAWDATRRRILAEYLCGKFGLPFDEAKIVETPEAEGAGPCYSKWPQGAKTADEIAISLTGKDATKSHLWEVFEPSSLPPNESHPILPGNACQILSQFEIFLKRR